MARPLTVYILASRSRALYIGTTNDLATRMAQHRRGLSAHTSKYGIDRLVHIEEYPDLRDAVVRERQLKGWTRAKKTALIELANPTWKDLDASRYG